MRTALDALQQERTRLFEELAQIGDLRRGSIAENYRRCGKPTCCCAREEHRGHGPQYLLMTKVEGRSHAKNLRVFLSDRPPLSNCSEIFRARHRL